MPSECPTADILYGRDPMIGINDLLSDVKGQARMHRALLGPDRLRPIFSSIDRGVGKEHLNLNLIFCQQQSAAFDPTMQMIDSKQLAVVISYDD